MRAFHGERLSCFGAAILGAGIEEGSLAFGGGAESFAGSVSTTKREFTQALEPSVSRTSSHSPLRETGTILVPCGTCRSTAEA